MASFVITGSSARADQIIFSDLGPPAATGSGNGILGAAAQQDFPSFSQAVSFSPSVDSLLSTISVGISWQWGVNSIVLDLASSAPDGGVGQTLEEWTLTSLPAYDPSDPLTQVVSNANIQLDADQTYWLVASAGDPSTAAFWDMNTSQYWGQIGYNRGGQGWLYQYEYSGEVQVTGVPTGSVPTTGTDVPEIDPSSTSTALTMLAGVTLIFVARKKEIAHEQTYSLEHFN